jgi:DNA-binding SARP family transcriptional activator
MRFLMLGPLEVCDEGGVVALGGIKPRAVLAMLLLHANEPVSAERLAVALWGEDAPAGVAKNVYVHVSRLRSALGDRGVIETTPAGYRLRVGADELDVARFERLAEDGRRALAEGQPEQAGVVLREALGLWRGPPLAELAWEPFAGAEIARLEEQRLATLEARIEADLGAGRHYELVGELRQLVAVHPTRERLAADLMLALYRCGRQSEALEVYQDTRRLLVTEVGIEPGLRLRKLQDAILRHDESLEQRGGVSPSSELDAVTASPNGSAGREMGVAAGPVRVALPRALDSSGPFVGRDNELAVLRERWAKASDAVGSMVVIAGEPGIGKTRLASELAAEVHEAGALVLYGRCDEGLGVPYQPFVEALRPCARALGVDRLRTELVELAPQLGRLLPELAGLGEPADGASGSERLALFEAVVALIEVLTRDQRALLIVDDLHWAALPTLLLLRHLLRCDRPLGLLIVGSYRETDLSVGNPLGQLLADLQRDGGVEYVRIGGLSGPAIASLLQAAATSRTLRQPLDQHTVELAQLLEAQTAGNPFFMGELLAHLCESGAIASESGLLRLDATTAQLNVPRGLRQVIGQRVARLSESAQRTLRVAAVAGPTFSLRVLERALGEQAGVLDALDEGVVAGLLTEAGQTDYAFAHALVRQTIYEDLGAARRMRLHRQLGEAIEALDHTDAHLEALAHHFAHAAADGQADKAARYALAAGHSATARTSYEQAAAHYQRGLDSLALSAQPHQQRRCELLLGLGAACWDTGELDEARHAYTQAAKLADQLGDATALARAALGFSGPHRFQIGPRSIRLVVDLLQRALAALGDDDSALHTQLTSRLTAARAYEEAAENYERALQANELREPADLPRRCDLLLELGTAQSQVGDSQAAHQTFLQAASLARKLNSPECLARAAIGYGAEMGGFEFGRVDDGLVALLGEAREALGPQDDPLLARVLGRLASELYYSDRNEERVALGEQAVAMAWRIGDRATLASTLSARFLTLWGPENALERLQIASDVVALGEEVRDRELVMRGHHWRVVSLMELGDWVGADIELAVHARLAEELRDPLHLWHVPLFRAARALLEGRLVDAERLTGEAFAVGRRVQAQNAAQVYAAQLFVLRGEQGRLAEMARPLEEFVRRYPVVPVWRAAAAFALAVFGRTEDARRAFEALTAGGLAQIRRDGEWLSTVAILISTGARIGEAKRTSELGELIAPYADRAVIAAGGTVCLGPVSRYAAIAAATAGRTEEAIAHYQHALAAARRWGAEPLTAGIQLELADVLERNLEGFPDHDRRARELRAEGLQSAQRLELAGLQKHWEDHARQDVITAPARAPVGVMPRARQRHSLGVLVCTEEDCGRPVSGPQR